MNHSTASDRRSDHTVKGIHVVTDGDPAGSPLLLIHGSGATGSTWEPVLSALASAHYVVTIDLPGCGRSEPSSTYDVPVQADRVASVVDELRLKPLKVVGHSSGGYVATALMEQRPDLVSSAVMVSTGPSLTALLPQPAILRALTGPVIGPLLWPVRTNRMISGGLAATAALPIEASDQMIADLRRTPYRTLRAILAANGAYIAQRTVPDRLARLGKPVLVIFGDSDPRWDPSSARMYDVVPQCAVEYLPGVGHLAMLEDPAGLARLVLAR